MSIEENEYIINVLSEEEIASLDEKFTQMSAECANSVWFGTGTGIQRSHATPFVGAHINNISFPKTIDELEMFIYKHGCFNVEDIINDSAKGYTVWTVPRHSAIGDLVLFFHAKTAIQWIRKLETDIKSLDEGEHDKNLLMEWLNRARRLYSLYGGKIFAIGRVSSSPEREEYSDMDSGLCHWGSKIYAEISNVVLLDNPIDISEFNSFILVSRQSGITPLPANEFQKLKEIIVSKNTDLPEYFIHSKIGSCNLSKINAKNFLEKTKDFRTRFLLEAEFRSYYVDYFLQALVGRSYYRECRCYTKKNPLARVDNVFVLKGKSILLEVKLNIHIEKNLIEQLNQYINADYIYLTNLLDRELRDFERDYMYVIDVFGLYKYIPKLRQLKVVTLLDDIKTKEDIKNCISIAKRKGPF